MLTAPPIPRRTASTASVIGNPDLLGMILHHAVWDVTTIDTLNPCPERPALRLLSRLAGSLLDSAVLSYLDLRFSSCGGAERFNCEPVARQAANALLRLPSLREIRVEVRPRRPRRQFTPTHTRAHSLKADVVRSGGAECYSREGGEARVSAVPPCCVEVCSPCKVQGGERL